MANPNIAAATAHKNMELIFIHKRDKRGFINYPEFLQALKDRYLQQQNDNNRHYQILEFF